MNIITNVKIIKKKNNLICFSYKEDNIPYFAKLFYLNDDEKLTTEYKREVNINNHIINNIPDFKYNTKLLKVYENIIPFDFILGFVKDKKKLCNILIYEHSGNHTLRFYINKLSSKNFNNILQQLKDATDILESHNIIHYDLYCESNIMLKKNNNKWELKIIDYGLSYIDETDKTKLDYNTALDSIIHYNKKHTI
jgi:hypothetical protein